MLKRLYNFIRPNSQQTRRQVYSRDHHSVSRKHISSGALKVMSRLNQAGYEAYLVGGGVRDLLLEGRPKDFDIATSATPEQVKRLFRRARIIGRRFKIVHVRMGREIIETTTFRAHHSDSNKRNESSQSDSGMLLKTTACHATVSSSASSEPSTMARDACRRL